MSSKQEIYQEITNKIVSLLEEGVVPWHKPWRTESGECLLPHNFFNDKPYNGINLLILSCSGYSSPVWMTEKQAEVRHGRIKEGEKPHSIVFYTPCESKTTGNVYAFLKRFHVYNLEQTEGVKPLRKSKVISYNNSPIEEAEKIIENYSTRPRIEYGNRAGYNVEEDRIVVPSIEKFEQKEEYYSTLFHELIHSTGAKDRLNRKILHAGIEEYSREELIAELGSAFLCAKSGINNTIENSASYIQGWIRFIKSDPSAIILASSAAQKAVNYILRGGKKAKEVKKEAAGESTGVSTTDIVVRVPREICVI